MEAERIFRCEKTFIKRRSHLVNSKMAANENNCDTISYFAIIFILNCSLRTITIKSEV